MISRNRSNTDVRQTESGNATRDVHRAANRLRMAASRALEPPEDTSVRREAARNNLRAAEKRLKESCRIRRLTADKWRLSV